MFPFLIKSEIHEHHPIKVDIGKVEDFLANYDTFIFDADGVLWLGSEKVYGADALLNQLIGAGKRVIILTNNSTKTSTEYALKCQKLGFTDMKDENIVSAALVAAFEVNKLMTKRRAEGKSNLPIYLVGSNSLRSILEAESGVECFGTGPDNIGDYTKDTFLMNVDVSRKVCAVMGSFDPHISYVKIMKAVNYLKDPEVEFFITNEDLTFPGTVPGIIVPGAGTVATVLRAVSGRTPTVFGKPHTACFNYIQHRFGIDPKRTLMVGDRCDTDIWFGNIHSMDTLLVLTGINNLNDVVAYSAGGKPELVPKFYTESVKDLIRH